MNELASGMVPLLGAVLVAFLWQQYAARLVP